MTRIFPLIAAALIAAAPAPAQPAGTNAQLDGANAQPDGANAQPDGANAQARMAQALREGCSVQHVHTPAGKPVHAGPIIRCAARGAVAQQAADRSRLR